MELEELKTAWGVYDKKIMSTQTITQKLIESMIKERSVSRVERLKKQYFAFFALLIIEAGFILAKALKKYRHDPGLVMAVPRGGVPIACIVASELGFPLDLLLTKKIGYPGNPEYAIGAVSLSDRYVVPHDGVSQAYIDEETIRIREKLKLITLKFTRDQKLI